MKKRKLNLTFPLTVTFVLMVLVVVYTSALFYRISVSNVYEVGQDKISGLAASLGNYLDTTKSVLWVTADSVDYMVRNGASDDIIQDFLVVETQRHKSQFDANYTGLYGYIGNKYYDGLGWIPPEDYVPTERDWYKLTAKEEGLVRSVSQPWPMRSVMKDASSGLEQSNQRLCVTPFVLLLNFCG